MVDSAIVVDSLVAIVVLSVADEVASELVVESPVVLAMVYSETDVDVVSAVLSGVVVVT